MHALQKIEFLQALMAMFIPNVGALLIIMAVNTDKTDILSGVTAPKWMLPIWLLAIIWCSFYCVIGYASNIVFNNREIVGKWSVLTKASLTTYGAHLLFSWLWSLIFFYKEDAMLAMITMVLVDVTAFHATYLFYKVKSLAGYLFMPYVLWLTFLTILNCNIIVIN